MSISLRIDGQLVQAELGQTVLEVARSARKSIPTLCHFDGLTDVGACRLCVVEVAGTGRLLPSCTTPAQDGMSVITNSERLARYRRMVVEFLLTERNHVCAVCVSNEHCELQSAARDLGVTFAGYEYNNPRLKVDMTHPRFVLDHNRCILCQRCVRICAEIEGAHVWDVMSRGIRSRLACDMDQAWGASLSCTGCGKCVQACPTGALAEKGFGASEMVKKGESVARLGHAREVRA